MSLIVDGLTKIKELWLNKWSSENYYNLKTLC